MSIEFTKLHGLGNDYLFIDCMEREVDDPESLSRAMSHRHLGVGRGQRHLDGLSHLR